MRRSVAEDARNANWKEVRIDALLLLADAQAQRGRLSASRASIDAACPLAAALSAQDPANNAWRVSLGKCRWWQAQLDTARPTSSTVAAADAAASLLATRACRRTQERAHAELAGTGAQPAGATGAAQNGDMAVARTHLAAARALIEPAWQAEQNETLRLWLAKTRLLEGEAAQLGREHRGGWRCLDRGTAIAARRCRHPDSLRPTRSAGARAAAPRPDRRGGAAPSTPRCRRLRTAAAFSQDARSPRMPRSNALIRRALKPTGRLPAPGRQGHSPSRSTTMPSTPNINLDIRLGGSSDPGWHNVMARTTRPTAICYTGGDDGVGGLDDDSRPGPRHRADPADRRPALPDRQLHVRGRHADTS